MANPALKKLFLYAFACFALLPGICELALCDIDNRPIVVFREDDARGTWRIPFKGLNGLSGLQYGKLKHIPITWGIISNWATTGSGGYSLVWSELKDYLDAAGGEAASHSAQHSSMLSKSAYINELTSSRAAIQQNLPGYSCNTFLQPGNWTGDGYIDEFAKLDNTIGVAIQANYTQSQMYLGGGWQIGSPYYHHGTGVSYSVDANGTPSIPALMSTLDVVAATPGLIFIITGHGVQEQGGYTNYEIPADTLRALLDRLADLRDQGEIRVMSLHDAYHAQFSPDLNIIPDSSFEYCNPGSANPAGPWFISGAAALETSSGINGSRCAYISGSSGRVQCKTLIIPPGRYRLEWYQKAILGNSSARKLYAVMSNNDPKYSDQQNTLDWASFANSTTNIWEKKSVLVTVKEKHPIVYLTFASDGRFYIDNISLLPEPLAPSISPSQTTIVESPGTAKVSWVTPSDPTIIQIIIRYGGDRHPLNLTEGIAFGSVPAIAGFRQEINSSINWTTQSTYVHFSVFGVRNDGSLTPPDLVLVKVDKTGPTQPVVDVLFSATNMPINVFWSSTDAGASIYQYQYCVSSTADSADLLPWISTHQTSAAIELPPQTFGTAYISVKAQNGFGAWSPVGHKSIDIANTNTIIDARGKNDGTSVTISGIVSAVYGDCCYIESSNWTGGIQVRGVAGIIEGSTVNVSGIIETEHGERYVQTN